MLPTTIKTKPKLSKVKKHKLKKKTPKKTTINKAVSEGNVEAVKVNNLNESAMENIHERFPVLKNKELIQSFLAVPMNNNQRGRIRQVLKDKLQGTSAKLLPEMINSKIQSILKSSETLQEVDLRKLRILFNMLKTASIEEMTQKTTEIAKEKKTKKKESSPSPQRHSSIPQSNSPSPQRKSDGDKNKSDKKIDNDKTKNEGDKGVKKDDKKLTTAKGVKRYVVFVGNLPLDINKEKVTQHFKDFADKIKDIRIPDIAEGKKSAIAYLELKDELGYELALSKHHSMFGNKRINVLYSMQKNSKMSKEEAKSRSAKLIALQKSGQLMGSTPLNRKRSARRKKMKAARAKEAAE